MTSHDVGYPIAMEVAMFRLNSSEDPDRRRGPRKLGEVMPQLMARRGYGRLLSHDEFQEAWQAVSGVLMQQSRPGQLRRGVLEIIVNNSVVMQELTFQKRSLLRQLNERLPHQPIRDLRFTVGLID
jgi:predicted nucleic acid-binding Zn ribbon protein